MVLRSCGYPMLLGMLVYSPTDAPSLPPSLSPLSSPPFQATGLRFGTTMQLILGVVVAIIVAFEASWQLSMVVVSLMPFVAIAGFFQLRLQTGRAGKNKERFESTGQISTESIENIRTVQAFGLEKRRIDTYYANLRSPVK